MQFHVDSTTEVDVVPAQTAFVDHAGRLRNATVGGIFREGLDVIEKVNRSQKSVIQGVADQAPDFIDCKWFLKNLPGSK